MKRIATAAAAIALLSFPGQALAATLQPLDPDGLNLRAGPGTSYEILGALAAWDSVGMVSQEGDWVRVRRPDGTLAWVSATYSRISYEDETAWAVVNTDVLNVRSAPSLSGDIVTQVTQGTVVRLLEVVPDWWRVRLSDGTKGWVFAEYMVRSAGTAASSSVPAKETTPTENTGAGETAVGTESGGTAVSSETQTAPIPPVEPFDRPRPSVGGGSQSNSGNPGSAENPSLPAAEPETAVPGTDQAAGPVLQSIWVRSEADRTVYTFQLTGAASASAAASGGAVVVTLPGVQKGNGPVPTGVLVQRSAAGLQVVIPTTLTYTLKQIADGYELHLYQPGLAGKVVLLDPGHGGSDPGTVNWSLGVQEKQVNLAVAQKVSELLAAKGANVLMTRDSDRLPAPDEVLEASNLDPIHADLDYRTRLANDQGVDVFISLHHNSASATARGTETYYTSETLNGGQSQVLAKLMQQYLTQATGLLNRGAKDYDYYVTRNTDAPAVLVELNFLSNPDECQKAADSAFQETEAQAIVRALEAFYGEKSN